MRRDGYEEALRSGEYCDMIVDVEEVLERIESVYGNLDDECGCYCNRNWMSVRDFVGMIVDCAHVNWDAVN